MASNGKKKTTMAKLTRENRVRERRLEKQAKKHARRHAPAQPMEEQPMDEQPVEELLDAEPADLHPRQPGVAVASSGGGDTTGPASGVALRERPGSDA
jgi:hypothetical protein